VLGYVWDELPDLYAITDVYCSPSVMEGFGMSVQEAAATKAPIVGSEHIPFVDEYLLGDDVHTESLPGGEGELRVGDGAIVVAADDAGAYAAALEKLLQDEALRRKMGERAYDITIPHFTWEEMTERFLDALQWEPAK
ncbi:MAG: glycosyltransferase family 4 protein, partial [Chloroflexota bacterium]